MPHSSKDVSIEVLLAQGLASNEPKVWKGHICDECCADYLINGCLCQVRDRHVKKLSKFLRAKCERGGLGEDELLKLWKGLFYCFWMSDKVSGTNVLLSRRVNKTV